MGKVLLVNSIKDITGDSKPFSEGQYGKCYKQPNNKVFKHFDGHTPIKYDTFNRTTREEIIALSDLSIPNIITPEILVILRENLELSGYIADFIYGPKLIKLPPNILIDQYISKIPNIMKRIFELSYKEYYAEDLASRNMIYNGEFYIYDTDFYTRKTVLPPVDLLKINTNMLNTSIIISLIGKNFQQLIKLVEESKSLAELSIITEDESSKRLAVHDLIKFLEALLNELENRVEKEIKTTGNFSLALSQIR